MVQRVQKRVQKERGKSEKGYHRLLVWQRARELVSLIYKVTIGFPREELFGLTSQLRRAVVSVLLNIVEGHNRESTVEVLRFFEIARGSLAEVEACLEISLDLGYLDKKTYDEVEKKRAEVAFLIFKYRGSLRNKGR
ncbi:four helix bundle protein [Candidatus Parcubacteria bacterium]|nr:four helix bundle protein [Candidatus Parcubacteria bacterium]